MIQQKIKNINSAPSVINEYIYVYKNCWLHCLYEGGPISTSPPDGATIARDNYYCETHSLKRLQLAESDWLFCFDQVRKRTIRQLDNLLYQISTYVGFWWSTPRCNENGCHGGQRDKSARSRISRSPFEYVRDS